MAAHAARHLRIETEFEIDKYPPNGLSTIHRYSSEGNREILDFHKSATFTPPVVVHYTGLDTGASHILAGALICDQNPIPHGNTASRRGPLTRSCQHHKPLATTWLWG